MISTELKKERVLTLQAGSADVSELTGPVLYWMYRDQRVQDNAALFRAQEVALSLGKPVCVIITLRSDLSNHAGTARWFEPMAEGLQQVAEKLKKLNISFILLFGDPLQELPEFITKHEVSAVVCDFSPLKIPRDWQRKLAIKTNILWECVDAHNVVPVWTISNKQEFAARTFRPKIHELLDDFLTPVPLLLKHPHAVHQAALKKQIEKLPASIIQKALTKKVKVDRNIGVVDWFRPGEKQALETLDVFITKKLAQYDSLRNDPTKDALSGLSPYLHFGYLSPLRMLVELRKLKPNKNIAAFIEEAVVRRELSDNYCFYNDHYDSLDGAPAWALETLEKHANDQRAFIYDYSDFERARTHDPAWNAAQNQLLKTGKMHGYMRMYWAKKILEWTRNPKEAISIAIRLNDLYELDGRDPNGYTGIMWSIAGVHDRPWFERPIFGKIRYMNANGLKRKFAIQAYIEQWNG